MKKILFTLCLVFSSSFAFADLPVIDITAAMNTIEEIYNQYQELQNTIEQVQNTYRQIEQAAQQVAKFDWSKLQNLGENFNGMSSNPFEVISGVRNSAKDITSMVNDQMNKINNVTHKLNERSITFGGMSVSVADLCGASEDKDRNVIGFVKNAAESTKEKAQEVADAWAGKLSYEERRAIAQKYGMSAENYAANYLVSKTLHDMIENQNVWGTLEGVKDTLTDCSNSAAALQEAAKNIPDGSISGAIDITNSSLAQGVRTMGNLEATLKQLVGFNAEKERVRIMKEDIEREQKVKEQEQAERNSASAIGDPNF